LYAVDSENLLLSRVVESQTCTYLFPDKAGSTHGFWYVRWRRSAPQ